MIHSPCRFGETETYGYLLCWSIPARRSSKTLPYTASNRLLTVVLKIFGENLLEGMKLVRSFDDSASLYDMTVLAFIVAIVYPVPGIIYGRGECSKRCVEIKQGALVDLLYGYCFEILRNSMSTDYLEGLGNYGV